MPLPWLNSTRPDFPPTQRALTEPNGLLAAGGALTRPWLQAAYRRGIFPWFESGQPILWWTPDPRMVLEPEKFHVSRSFRKFLRKNSYTLTFDSRFEEVITACAAPRIDSDGTWITAAMRAAYMDLHRAGMAHSVEVCDAEALVGGLYGVALGRVFFGESMFSRRDNVSKLALYGLTQHLRSWGFGLIDCQVSTPHLLSLGAGEISRSDFERRLRELVDAPARYSSWQFQDRLLEPDRQC